MLQLIISDRISVLCPLDEFHRMCLDGAAVGGYPEVDTGILGGRIPQKPNGHDSTLNGQTLYPVNGNGHIYPQIPQIPHIPQIPQIPYIPFDGNGNGQRPQGPVGELHIGIKQQDEEFSGCRLGCQSSFREK